MEDTHNKIIEYFINKQRSIENKNSQKYKKENGIFFTNDVFLIKEVLQSINYENILNKKILEPSWWAWIFIIAIVVKMYYLWFLEKEIINFIKNNVYFIEINNVFLKEAKKNINELLKILFNKEYKLNLNFYLLDFTKKDDNFFTKHIWTFDYIIWNPPFVSLYWRRWIYKTEKLRKYYLKNYKQFPDKLQNWKLNLSMFFIENAINLLNDSWKVSFILDITFFETAFYYTRKFLIENNYINKIVYNISSFKNVASWQIILHISKDNNKIINVEDFKNNKNIKLNKKDLVSKEYNIPLYYCERANNIIKKIEKHNKLWEIFPKKSLRTSAMLLSFEADFTIWLNEKHNFDDSIIFPYYQGSKSLKEKNWKLYLYKKLVYNKKLQDEINNKLKIELENKWIKNKKRIWLWEFNVYNNPKIFIRQSAKELIASFDENKSSANMSLYIFSLRNNSKKTIKVLKYLTAYINSDIITFYAQKTNIIRNSIWKQPQIKISDLNKLPIPMDVKLINDIFKNYNDLYIVNKLINNYFAINKEEYVYIKKNIKNY